jgi:hypothetical protein
MKLQAPTNSILRDGDLMVGQGLNWQLVTGN